MNDSLNWEFILLVLKEEIGNLFVGIMFCYKNNNYIYVLELIGMDYKWVKEY